jgi:23S rRNA (cytidine1920-2'-O)/16S rRNA (cytidine1409-2'-O)-methyltransferase
VVKDILQMDGEIVALIKPQFEAGQEKVGKKGVVKDPLVHREVILKMLDAAKSLALFPVKLSYSPLKGPEGNIEYLLYLKNMDNGIKELKTQDVVGIVAQAHADLS